MSKRKAPKQTMSILCFGIYFQRCCEKDSKNKIYTLTKEIKINKHKAEDRK